MTSTNCPCGSGETLAKCCGPFIAGEASPPTAEKLMRSRYTAYTQANIGYIKKTSAPEALKDFDVKAAQEWAESADWKSLKIVRVDKGAEGDKKGTVEFVATYRQEGHGIEHHEVSEFRKDGKGAWLFVEGESHTHEEGQGHHHHHPVRQETVVREQPKIGRNDPCPCGSGKKFKKCCGAA